ncbi:MAG: acetyl-CoA C-acetyltransferase [Burkholderiales bacterium]|nr:acetyl-CoA C-acetyltransferase [Burkholderiales bacterium]
MANAAFVYEAIRTPRGKGKKDGSLHEVKPIRLLSGLLRDLAQRTQLDTSRVDDAIIGCVTPVGDQGANIAKTALLMADWDVAVPGFQLNRFCASALEAVNIAAQKVASGWEDLIVAGGIESMSRVPMMSDGGAWAMDPETSMRTAFVPQGIGADLIATLAGFTREDVDGFALRSQKKAAKAQADGLFTRSVVPVRDDIGQIILGQDEFIKPNTEMNGLAQLKPSFEQLGAMGFDVIALSKYPQISKINHVHTAGNSSGVVDGASAVLIGSEKAGRELNLQARARIVSVAITSTEPTIMLAGPGPASRLALRKAGLTPEDIDLYEVNEAFASVVMRFMRELNVPEEKVNVTGGSIALGHPLGATGAMIIGMLIDELERRKLKRGLATMCVGGGIGIATIIERV